MQTLSIVLKAVLVPRLVKEEQDNANDDAFHVSTDNMRLKAHATINHVDHHP